MHEIMKVGSKRNHPSINTTTLSSTAGTTPASRSPSLTPARPNQMCMPSPPPPQDSSLQCRVQEGASSGGALCCVLTPTHVVSGWGDGNIRCHTRASGGGACAHVWTIPGAHSLAHSCGVSAMALSHGWVVGGQWGAGLAGHYPFLSGELNMRACKQPSPARQRRRSHASEPPGYWPQTRDVVCCARRTRSRGMALTCSWRVPRFEPQSVLQRTVLVLVLPL